MSNIGTDKNNKHTKFQKTFIFLISTVCVLMLFYYMGQSNNRYDIQELGKLLDKYQMSLNWDSNSKKMILSKNNNVLSTSPNSFTIINIEDFSTMEAIIAGSNDIKVTVNKNFFFNYINYIFLGIPLTNDINKLRLIVTSFDNVYSTNKDYIEKYYSYIYPYKVGICDTDFDVKLLSNLKECKTDSHINLTVNGIEQNFSLVIDYYPEWKDFKLENYMVYTKQGISEKLTLFKSISSEVTNKYNSSLDEKKIAYINSEKKRIGLFSDDTRDGLDIALGASRNYIQKKNTIRDLKIDVLVKKVDSDDYIEPNLKLTKYYAAIYDNEPTVLNSDLEYILINLSNTTKNTNKQSIIYPKNKEFLQKELEARKSYYTPEAYKEIEKKSSKDISDLDSIIVPVKTESKKIDNNKVEIKTADVKEPKVSDKPTEVKTDSVTPLTPSPEIKAVVPSDNVEIKKQ